MLHDLGLLLSNKNPDRLFKSGSISHFILISILVIFVTIFSFIACYYIGYYGVRMQEWLNLINISETHMMGFVKCYENEHGYCLMLGILYTLIVAGIFSGLFLIMWGCIQFFIECKKAYSSAHVIEVNCELLEIGKEC